MICDFCSSPKVMYSYPAKEATTEFLPMIVMQSDGLWAACEVCSAMIETQSWEALIQRSIDTQPIPFLTEDQVREAITEIHMMFRKSQNGERRSLHN